TVKMKFGAFIFLFFLSVSAFAQSVVKLIENDYLYYKNNVSTKPDSSLMHLQNALKLNHSYKDKNWEADLTYGIGYCYFTMQNYKLAIEYFEKAIKLAEELSNHNIISKAYNNIGLIYSYQNKTKIALDYYHKSLQISENREEFNDNTISVFTNIADLYIMQRDTVNARRYYQMAKQLGEKEDQKLNLAIIY